MISLVPSWARYYEEFWNTVKRRNFWFIKLRYAAVLMLLFLIFTSEFILNVKFSEDQENYILLITFSILLYNIILHYSRKFVRNDPAKFNPLHFSLLQMVLDLYALTLLVYYTGTIESPLYMLFIFHMIIGSLVLPGFIIYSTALTSIVIFTLLTAGEYFGIIQHHSIEGFLASPVYNDFKYVSAFLSIFTFIMIMSVVLANRIAQQLYKMEQDLVESFNRLNAAEIEKQKYIMSVVHEIKTPISALHSYLDLILQKFLGPLDEKVEDKLKRAVIRSDEAIRLINNILQISRLRLTGETAKQPVDLRELLCSVITKHKINIEAKKIRFEIKDEIKKIDKIKGDSLLLEIAFSNLLGNAVKYADKGGIVEVRLTRNENNIFIEICDNGIGIPPHEVEKIFNDFYRASNIKQKGYEGSGMGLSIVKQIIERHGGTIRVESPSDIGDEKNPGTSVKVNIPAQ